MWERYCRGVFAILYVVDVADRDNILIAKSKLQDLLTRPSLSGIPLLLLGNKTNKFEALSMQVLVNQMDLEAIKGREVWRNMISCKESVNIDAITQQLSRVATESRSPPVDRLWLLLKLGRINPILEFEKVTWSFPYDRYHF